MGLRRRGLHIAARRAELDPRRVPPWSRDPAVLRLRALAGYPDGRVVGKTQARRAKSQAGLLRDGSVGLDGDDGADPLVETAYPRFPVSQPVQQCHVHRTVLRADRVPHGTLRRRTGARAHRKAWDSIHRLGSHDDGQDDAPSFLPNQKPGKPGGRVPQRRPLPRQSKACLDRAREKCTRCTARPR